MSKRRTYPGYLSESEAWRESERVDQAVKGFKKLNPICRLGETENFIVEYDSREKLVYVYGTRALSV
jgi:hypothetical protein